MTAIDEMLIHNVDLEDGDQGAFWVSDVDLKWQYPSEYREDFSEDEFFSLALRYLEEYGKDIESVDYAKIDYYTRHTE